MTRTNVLVIGSGRRVQRHFLPAFSCLDQIEVAGIHSRTRERLDAVARAWNIPPVYTLDAFDFTKVDIVVVVVAHDGIVDVLEKLRHAAPGLTLIIDTPVFAHLKDFWRVDLLQRFKNVLVAEDYQALPAFKLLQPTVSGGLIGPVRHVHLLNAGWSYHGFSLIRKVLDYPPLLWLTASRFYGEKREVRFWFAGNKTATLVDPFDVDEGRILVAGERGVIANYKLHDATAFHLETLRDERGVPHYRIQTREGGALTYSPKHYARLASMHRPDLDEFNMQKTLGLIDLIEEFLDNTDRRYGYLQGLADHAFSKFAYGAGLFFDPFAAFGTSALSLLDRGVAAIKGGSR